MREGISRGRAADSPPGRKEIHMSQTALKKIMTSCMVIVFILSFSAGAFAGIKGLRSYNCGQYLEGMSTYYQMVPNLNAHSSFCM